MTAPHAPEWYTEPTNECCHWCGKQHLTRYEVESNRRCEDCIKAGAPSPCECEGVAFCSEGIHVRIEEQLHTDGVKRMVEVVRRVRNANGALVLERCPKQAEYYARKRGRALARQEAGPRPVGIR